MGESFSRSDLAMGKGQRLGGVLLLLFMMAKAEKEVKSEGVQLMANHCEGDNIQIKDVIDCAEGEIPKEEIHSIWNKKQFMKLQGYTCSRHRSRRYSYCGHYSVTKELGRGSFDVPEEVSTEECWQSVEKQIIEEKVTHKDKEEVVKIGVKKGLNTIELMTMGRIHYHPTTPTCEGVNLHFDNHTIMSNMLEYNFIKYEIQPVELTWRIGENLVQHGVGVLGSLQNGTGVDARGRTVWKQPTPSCPLEFVSNMKFQTYNKNVKVNDQHGVYIQANEPFYMQECSNSFMETNAIGIFLGKEELEKKEDLQVKNIRPGSNQEVEMEFLHHILVSGGHLKKAMTTRRDKCQGLDHNGVKISNEKNDRTEFLHRNNHYLVVYECKKVVVESRSNDSCYDGAPVRFLEKDYFLDPNLNVLVKNSQQLDCRGVLPIFRAGTGKAIIFNPGPQVISTHVTRVGRLFGQLSQLGIYFKENVAQYFTNLYKTPEANLFISRVNKIFLGDNGEQASANLFGFFRDGIQNMATFSFLSIFGLSFRSLLDHGVIVWIGKEILMYSINIMLTLVEFVQRKRSGETTGRAMIEIIFGGNFLKHSINNGIKKTGEKLSEEVKDMKEKIEKMEAREKESENLCKSLRELVENMGQKMDSQTAMLSSQLEKTLKKDGKEERDEGTEEAVHQAVMGLEDPGMEGAVEMEKEKEPEEKKICTVNVHKLVESGASMEEIKEEIKKIETDFQQQMEGKKGKEEKIEEVGNSEEVKKCPHFLKKGKCKFDDKCWYKH